MAAKNKSARTRRREAERARAKLLRQARALAEHEPGGAPERPIEVISAAIIEVHALGFDCLECGASALRLEEHAARELSGQRLRVVDLQCRLCGAERRVYFRIGGPALN